MAYGIEVLNNAGSFLIDGESPNFSLLATGTVASGTAVTIPTTTIPPLVFIRFNTASRFARISGMTTTSVTFQVYDSPADSGTFSNPTTGNVEYMIFGVASVLSPSSGFGIHLFNSSGALIFDSNVKVPRIKEVVTAAAISTPSDGIRHPNTSVTHSQGTNPWMLANFTFNYYGYVFMGDSPGTLSQLLWPAMRSDTSIGNRILIQAVNGTTIGSTGAQWPSAPMQVALIP
jgi:hypothetical protein